MTWSSRYAPTSFVWYDGSYLDDFFLSPSSWLKQPKRTISPLCMICVSFFATAFIFHITHDEFSTKIKICQIQLLLRIQWLFLILNEMYARIERNASGKKTRERVWHLNINVVTAKLRWKFGFSVSNNRARQWIIQSTSVVIFVFLPYVHCSCESIQWWNMGSSMLRKYTLCM